MTVVISQKAAQAVVDKLRFQMQTLVNSRGGSMTLQEFEEVCGAAFSREMERLHQQGGK